MSRYGKALCITHQNTNLLPPPPYATTHQPQVFKRHFCSICKENISEQVYDFSAKRFGAGLCMRHQKTVTPQALKLSRALKSYDVEHTLEYSDGHKHVDIAIPSAKLYLELDGMQHAFSPKQMIADDERDKHSLKNGYTTKRIPNAWVDKNVYKLAANIAILTKKREYELKEQERERAQKVSFTGIMKTVINTARKLSEKIDDFE
jgi:very-short-patch-repair endonuclease